MIVGFTGTQRGLSAKQWAGVRAALLSEKATEGHHGDCIGADAAFHLICIRLKIPVVIHPPTVPNKRAFCVSSQIKDPLSYLERNHRIVDSSDVLIAAPRTPDEELRSGTWATVRYARKVGKRVIIVTP